MLWLHGEFDAGFNEPDFLFSTNKTVSLALLEPRGSPKRKSLEPHCDPNPPRQYAAAADYGNQLQSLVQDLRADTSVQVPFATVSMRIFHASWSLQHQPHNVNVVKPWDARRRERVGKGVCRQGPDAKAVALL